MDDDIKITDLEDKILTPNMSSAQFCRQRRTVTFRDHLEDLMISEQGKRVKKLLTWKLFLGVALAIVGMYLLLDFRIVSDAEMYGPSSKCGVPLILYKDSAVRYNRAVPHPEISSSEVERYIAISECYLTVYAANVSCITPLSYGSDYRLVSFRDSGGELIHMIDPVPLVALHPKKVSQAAMFFPGEKADVLLPSLVKMDYFTPNRTKIAGAVFKAPYSYCIESSVRLFEGKM
jgi:hypothetical protein